MISTATTFCAAKRKQHAALCVGLLCKKTLKQYSSIKTPDFAKIGWSAQKPGVDLFPDQIGCFVGILDLAGCVALQGVNKCPQRRKAGIYV